MDARIMVTAAAGSAMGGDVVAGIGTTAGGNIAAGRDITAGRDTTDTTDAIGDLMPLAKQSKETIAVSPYLRLNKALSFN